jgi:DNA-binding response OmpR family regulator
MRVLILDDKEERADLAKLLAANNYDVTVETDGEAGLALYRDEPFDVVLLDLDVPRKGGSKVLVDLVSEFPKINVLVTARGPETISTRAYLDIAHDFGQVRALPKPFTAEHLLRGVDVMLNGGEWVKA